MSAERLQGILFSHSQRLGELWKTCAQPVVTLRYAFLETESSFGIQSNVRINERQVNKKI